MAEVLALMGGVGVIHRYNTPDQQADEVIKVSKKGLIVGAAVGIKDDYLLRAEKILNAGAGFLVVDVAHGHSESLAKAVINLRRKFPHTEIIAGNVATAEAVRFLARLKVSAIKVGIGPGSVCTTRIVTGFGIPQLSAILDTVKVASSLKLTVIADGGITNSGSIVKALAAGASTVMIGNLFAGTDEAPGKKVIRNGAVYKSYRGMASLEANQDRFKTEGKKFKEFKAASEGVNGLVSYKGSVVPVINELLGGIRSGLSYGGAKNISELQENAEFIEISSSGMRESMPHDVLLNGHL